MNKGEKRQLLIHFQRYFNEKKKGLPDLYIMGADIKDFLSTLPDEGENIDTEKEELIAEISKLQQTVKSLESALDNISQNGNS